ncbi:MAG: NAD(P)H-dependent oxidoreductase [Verrucomicrobiae bacterium]|nr:NAD(P)H-dependent oxidoreductase [Verrucomicrobiae bacterium]
MKTIRIISGTNRDENNTSKIAHELLRVYRDLGADVEIIDLRKLPSEIFSGAAYQEKPKGWAEFQDKIDTADGLVVITPEYNGSFPGVLTYFIDMLEFPKSLQGKPCCFIGLSAGIWGGLRAVEHLQDIFIYRGALIFPKSVFIPNIYTCLDEKGNITCDEIIERLKNQALSFIDFVSHSGKKD